MVKCIIPVQQCRTPASSTRRNLAAYRRKTPLLEDTTLKSRGIHLHYKLIYYIIKYSNTESCVVHSKNRCN